PRTDDSVLEFLVPENSHWSLDPGVRRLTYDRRMASPSLKQTPLPASPPSSTRSYGQGSTGPRTPEGKRAIAGNNLRHGLCSRRNVLPGEDATEFELFRNTLVRDLVPEGAVEELVVERIVSAGWRLRRAVRVENEVLELADQPRRLKATQLTGVIR